MFLAIAMLGVISFRRLPIDLLPDVAYPRTVAQIIADYDAAVASGDRHVINALKDALDADNNGIGGCPLN